MTIEIGLLIAIALGLWVPWLAVIVLRRRIGEGFAQILMLAPIHSRVVAEVPSVLPDDVRWPFMLAGSDLIRVSFPPYLEGDLPQTQELVLKTMANPGDLMQAAEFSGVLHVQPVTEDVLVNGIVHFVGIDPDSPNFIYSDELIGPEGLNSSALRELAKVPPDQEVTVRISVRQELHHGETIDVVVKTALVLYPAHRLSPGPPSMHVLRQQPAYPNWEGPDLALRAAVAAGAISPRAAAVAHRRQLLAERIDGGMICHQDDPPGTLCGVDFQSEGDHGTGPDDMVNCETCLSILAGEPPS